MNRREPTVIPNHLISTLVNGKGRVERDLDRRRRYRVYAAMVLVAGLGTALIVFLERLANQ